jgi:hypothetical protein
MSDWLTERIKLGRTELKVGRLGLGAAYGAPPESLEAAFDAGCNYFYWGALRNKKMAEAIRKIVKKGKRDDLVLVIQDFRRSSKGLEKSLMRGLKKAGLDYADVLLLGWHNKPPKPKSSVILASRATSGPFFLSWPRTRNTTSSIFAIMLPIEGLKRTCFPIFQMRGQESSFSMPQSICRLPSRKKYLRLKKNPQPEIAIVSLCRMPMWM